MTAKLAGIVRCWGRNCRIVHMSGDVGMQSTDWNSKDRSDVTLDLSNTEQHLNVYMLLMQPGCGVQAPVRQCQSTACAREGAPHGP